LVESPSKVRATHMALEGAFQDQLLRHNVECKLQLLYNKRIEMNGVARCFLLESRGLSSEALEILCARKEK
jgi:hypothetical protein